MKKFYLLAGAIYAGGAIGTTAAGMPPPAALAPISVRAVSDLQFPVAVTGDGPRSVTAGDHEDGENASFEVTGPPNQAFAFLLPETVPLLNRSRPSRPLIINDFRSNPPRGWPGFTDRNGRRTIYVGATRQAIGFDVAGGEYSGTFLIVTIY